jgi:tyrosyl-DNA phosphodiesterase 2
VSPSAGKTAMLLLLLAATLAGCSPRGDAGDGEATRPSDPPRTLTLLTWNVLANVYYEDVRWPAMLEAIRAADADVIALQEACPPFVAALLDQPWARGRYQAAPTGEDLARFRGDYVVTRLPVNKIVTIRLPSRQGRGAVVAELLAHGRRLAVATCHADSPLELGEVRARQLDVVFAALADADDAVLMGDLNFGDGAMPESRHVPPAYVDLWPMLRPGEPGLTWNNEVNPMARAGAFPGEPSRRIDRIFLRSAVWRGRSIRMLGEAPIGRTDDGSAVFCSDHFALLAELTWR